MERIGPNAPQNRVATTLSPVGPYSLKVTRGEAVLLTDGFMSRTENARIQRVRDVLKQYKGNPAVTAEIEALGLEGWELIVVPGQGIKQEGVEIGPAKYKPGKDTEFTFTDETGASQTFVLNEDNVDSASVGLKADSVLYVMTSVVYKAG